MYKLCEVLPISSLWQLSFIYCEKIQNIPVLQNHNSEVSDPSIVELALAERSLSWHLLQPGPQAETTMSPENNRFAGHHQPMQSKCPKGKERIQAQTAPRVQSGIIKSSAQYSSCPHTHFEILCFKCSIVFLLKFNKYHLLQCSAP